MKQPFRLICCIICSIPFLFSSCHKDVYDPEALGRDYFIQDIPEGFDWSTTATVQLEVTPYDQYNGRYSYKIEVFDKNPADSGFASLYTGGWCTGQKPLQKEMVLPAADTLVYIRQTTPGGRVSITSAMIRNKQITCNFNPQPAASPVLQKTSHNISLLGTTKDVNIPDTYPQNAKEITQSSHKLESNGTYVIKGSYTGKLDFNGVNNLSLYIAGTWNNTASSTAIEDRTNIYVLPGGKIITTKEWDIKINSSAVVAIAKGGQLGSKGKDEEDDISFDINQGTFWNEGIVYIGDIKVHSGHFRLVNYGEFHIDDLTTENSCVIENADQGTFYADDINLKNATFRNQCYAEIDEFKALANSKIEIASGGAIKCEELKVEGWNVSFKLHEKSMIEVTEETKIEQGGQINFYGGDDDFSLFKTKKFECEGNWYNALFNNNLYVEWEKADIKYVDSYHIYPPAQWVDGKKGSLIEIPASKCSMGNDYTPEVPQPEEFPQWITTTASYTYASEDNYPSPGDYDLNDLVLSLDSISRYYIKEGQENVISKMTLHITLRAVGAVWQLGAAIQLDGLNQKAVKRITYSRNDMPLSVFQINEQGVEKEPEYAVVPLFDNAHKLLGCTNTSTIINTISNESKWIYDVHPVSFDVTVEFNSPVDEKAVDIDKLNYFTIVGSKSKDRTEIHLPGYKHTVLSSSPENLQKITEKYMWTIKVPGIFRYPHEWEPITKVYEDFEKWVKSSGQRYEEWYKKPETELLYKNQ